ncbi:MAG: hypothetical protein B6D46_14790 [Polyangiaceae bacterium UTPRO1]|jgi:hypothetical protein|nr:hypothetical protein [Myxococcales bacterium]OQY65046.1 MAG: hypothetical protein B6D46_14790 [Polyangiaceae bacterium UTPRO1]
MVRTTIRLQGYRSLAALLLLLAVMAAGVVTSCGGGGGGGSDGGLCSQCGDSPDGPCIPSITISPGSGQPQCTRPPDANTGTCAVELTCRRKVDSAQRRCYPLAPGGSDVDYQFRCDGSRPGGTPGPPPTVTPTPEPTATVQQTCGNGIVEGTEQCDGGVGNATCGSQGCTPPGGILSCNPQTCRFDYSLCNSGGAGCRQ